MKESIEAANQPIPLKQVYRSELIEQLKAAGIKEAGEETKLGIMYGLPVICMEAVTGFVSFLGRVRG